MRLRHIKGALEFLKTYPDIVVTEIDKFEITETDKLLSLEIGCGKGQFIINMALENKDTYFIAVEKYDSVLLRAVEKYLSLEEKPNNLLFVLADFDDLAKILKPNTFNNIYLNFSDPWPKNRTAKRRLTNIAYLEIYKNILKQDGYIIQKTDNLDFFKYSLLEYEKADLKIIELSYDLHSTDIYNIPTEFEDKWSKTTPINYVKVGK